MTVIQAINVRSTVRWFSSLSPSLLCLKGSYTERREVKARMWWLGTLHWPSLSSFLPLKTLAVNQWCMVRIVKPSIGNIRLIATSGLKYFSILYWFRQYAYVTFKATWFRFPVCRYRASGPFDKKRPEGGPWLFLGGSLKPSWKKEMVQGIGGFAY